MFPLLISIKIVTVSLLIAFMLTLFLGWKLSKTNEKYKKIIECIIMIPIFFPPSAIGYLSLVILGRNGFIGKIFYYFFQERIIFSWGAGVITTIIVILPIMYINIKNGFSSIDDIYIEVGKEMGASKFQILKFIQIPMMKKNIYSSLILGFGRAFGEFGAIILVAGNIPKKTQTMTMALYSAVETGDYSEANKIILIIGIISLITLVLYSYVFNEKNRYEK